MASKIRIFRSTGTTAPGSLEYGELAVTVGTGGNAANKGGRLFIGDNGNNPVEIGGQYIYGLLDHTLGELQPNSAILVDSNSQIDGFDVSGMLTATRTNITDLVSTNLNITGVGTVAQLNITGLEVQNLKTTGITTIGDAESDTVQFIAQINSDLIPDSDDTFSIGAATSEWKDIFIDGLAELDDVNVSSAATIATVDINAGNIDNTTIGAATTAAGSFTTVTANTLTVGGTSTLENVDAGTVDAGTALRAPVGVVTTLTTHDVVGAAATFTEGFTLGTGGTKFNFPVVDGSTNQILKTDGSGQLSFADDAGGFWEENATGIHTTSSVGIGTTTANTEASQFVVVGQTRIQGNLNVTGVSTVGILTVTNDANIDGTLHVGGIEINGGASIGADITTRNLRATGITTLGDAQDDTVQFIAQINSDLIPDSDDTFSIGAATSEWKNIFIDGLAELDDVNVSSAATIATLNVTGDTTLDSTLNANGNVNLGNNANDVVTITANVTQTGITTITGSLTVDNVGINSNVISTRPGGGNQLFIDPYPDGLSNEGTVIIKGDLQVDGTTTTVNSNVVTVDDPIFGIGNTATVRTVIGDVGSGTTVVTLDSRTGINTGDVVRGTTALGNSGINTVHSFAGGSNQVNLISVTSAGITSSTQLNFTQGVDTNTDRGISFGYFNSGLKEGYFGWVDSTNRWTFIPDATITASVVSGTKGDLDVAGIFLQGTNTNGAAYFNSSGKLQSTVSPGSGISTSTYILTSLSASDAPTWTDTIDCGTF